ncbi:MauE/DoxX family redox-associated membrane protein [Micromonospora sp. CA-111912]|uniref:MauE/DoxX family redox-associated membrane protein n=1 Tax=Micromonospora sp. CA-111912 TaxID=3239955 RepID=UPI003D9497FC
MTTATLVVGVVACTTAAVHLCAGLGKLVAPEHAREAVAGLLRLADPVARRVVRLLALVETFVAVALLVPVLRPTGALLAGVLGLAFAGAGLLGRARGLRAPCGCFGRPESRPLGAGSVLSGLALVAAAIIVLRYGPRGVPHPDLLPVGTAGLAVAIVLWTWRDLARDLIRARPTPATRD